MLESARARLDELWQTVHRETNGEINQEIDQFITSRFVSIRFCLLTQLQQFPVVYRDEQDQGIGGDLKKVDRRLFWERGNIGSQFHNSGKVG